MARRSVKGNMIEYYETANESEAREERRQAEAQSEFLKNCDDQYW